eukprot:COSAG06_NODE_340_length_17187_cov_578.135475_2_plen_478_part_00
MIPGETYSLQLLWREPGWWHRQFNVYMDGTFLAHVDPAMMQGGLNNWHTAAAFLWHNFVASNSEVVIVLAGEDPTLFGLTLEHIAAQVHSGHVPDMSLRLVDDAYLQLPAVTLGAAIAVSAWVQVGTLWDGEVGITLFSSFESDGCLDSDVCRNAVDGTLDRGGWFAVGNDVNGKRPADLWTANAIYDQATAGLFWEGARDEWMMVTVSVSGRDVSVYSGDEQRGSTLLSTRLPRMLRHNNYVGATHHAPYQHKAGGITMAIADFRLYDRSLSSSEISALFADPASECCIGAGLKDAFGVRDLDLSLEAMRSDQPSAVTITPSEQHAGSDAGSDAQRGCVSDTAAATQQLDICGEITKVSECRGEIRDGTGPYADSLDCGLRLEGFIGSTYTLTFDEFETEAAVDFLRVYDGPSADAPLVAELSGKAIPAPIVSTGRTLYLHFHTNDNTAAVGFRVSFILHYSIQPYFVLGTVLLQV